MHTPRFYQPAEFCEGEEHTLDARASHHLAVVLRAKVGDSCELFSGDGLVYAATVVVVHKKHTQVLLGTASQPQTESPLHIHLAQCLSAADRMDYTVQKASELGVNEITPLFCTHMSTRYNANRIEKKTAHWQNVAISACEQSFRVRIPVIHKAQSLVDFSKTHTKAYDKNKYVLDVSGIYPKLSPKQPKQGIIILVGPESGLTEEELLRLDTHGFIKTSFGPRVLRTETVAPAVLAVVQHLWGDI